MEIYAQKYSTVAEVVVEKLQLQKPEKEPLDPDIPILLTARPTTILRITHASWETSWVTGVRR